MKIKNTNFKVDSSKDISLANQKISTEKEVEGNSLKIVDASFDITNSEDISIANQKVSTEKKDASNYLKIVNIIFGNKVFVLIGLSIVLIIISIYKWG